MLCGLGTGRSVSSSLAENNMRIEGSSVGGDREGDLLTSEAQCARVVQLK